ncbi:MAG: ABC transporter substrate-binding protein [Trueperaceae bacterium]|nr:ABC transporter substrate-binding protein [Trueperaceae bacterium]
MKRLFTVLAALAFGTAVFAQPFVWPDIWNADAQEIQELIASGDKPTMTLRDASLSGPRTFNRFVSTESNDVVDIEEALGANLLILGPDSEEWRPFAASEYVVAEDGTTIDVTLRDGLLWSDGTPITIDDYLATYEIETDEEVGAAAFDGWFIEGDPITVEALDDNTLRFNFPRPDRIALTLVASHLPTPPVLTEVYRNEGAEALRGMWGTETDPSELVFSAPWVLESYSPDERLIFTRNPSYGEWNVDEAGNPLPYLDELTYTIADQQAQLNLYLAGEIDIYNPANLDEVGTINLAVQNGDLDATVLESVSPVRSSSFFSFNWNLASDPWKQEVFRDARFRQAMSHLTPREAIVELVNGGAAIPAYSNVYQVLDFWYNPDVPKFTYDPEAALVLLEEIGFTETNSDGFLVDPEADRVLEFTLVTNAGNANREQTIQIIADAMREVGVNVETQAVDFNLLVDQLLSTGEDRPWESFLLSLSGGSRDWPFGTNTATCSGNLHFYNQTGECLTDAERRMEEIFFTGRQTLDNDEAQQLAYEFQTVQAELQPIIYTVTPLAHFSWLERVGGEHPDEYINTIDGSRELVQTFIR